VKNFPNDFLWGISTSAHQVEGGNENDWTEWEKNGRSKDFSGEACNHWNLDQFKKDLELAKKIGVNAYRLSLEWSRIMPQPYVINQEALEHYKEMLRHIRLAGMKTMVTLHHFTNPVWFAKMGGWLSAPLDPFFVYIKACGAALNPYVDLWLTFNEPNVYAGCGWIIGKWPPGKKGLIPVAWYVTGRMIKAHNQIYRIIKGCSRSPVGIVYNLTCFTSRNIFEKALNWLASYFANQEWWLNFVKVDFLGVDYYFRQQLELSFLPPFIKISPPTGPISDFGWEVYPEGIYQILHSLRKLNLPIYITENGIADAKDQLRGDFIESHLKQVFRAINKGFPVKGYFYWSLIDNFEWEEGYSKKFGLIEVDRATGARRLRQSAKVYEKIIKGNESQRKK